MPHGPMIGLGLLDTTAIVSSTPAAPTDIFLSATAFDEDTALGVIATISANGNPASTFSIIADPDNKFDISGSDLILDGAFDYETDTSHTVTIRATNGVGDPYEEEFTIQVNDILEATAPVAMVDADWSVDTGTGNQTVAFTIAIEPDDGGAAITDYQYDINGNDTWVSLGLSAPGTVERTMAAADTSYDFRVRAVNSVDPAPASNTESATSSAAASGVTSISEAGATFNFGSATVAGKDADNPNIVWAVAPFTLASEPTPAWDGSKNGAVLNPVHHGADRSWDNRGGMADRYIAQPTYPLAMSAGDILVKAIGEPSYGTDRNGIVQDYITIIAVSSAPATGTLAPAAIGWTGRAGALNWEAHNLDAVLSGLPRYTITNTSQVPTAAAILDQLDKLNIGYSITDQAESSSANGSSYEVYTPHNMGLDGGSNYGRNQGRLLGPAMMMLLADSSHVSDADRREIAVRIAQFGKQWYETLTGEGVNPGVDGGHHNFFYGPVSFYLAVTGQTTEMASLRSDLVGNWQGVFRLTAQDVIDAKTPHSDTSKFCFTRLRSVSSVSGNDIVVTGSNGAGGDPLRINFDGMTIVRQSDGATATVTSVSGVDISDGFATMTIDAQPSPAFASSDQVYFLPAYPIFEGGVDWQLLDATDSANNNVYIPTGEAYYRKEQRQLDECMFMKVIYDYMSVSTADFDDVIEYARLSQEALYPPPDDWSEGLDQFKFLDFTAEFYDEHGDALLGAWNNTAPIISGLVVSNITNDGFQIDFNVSIANGFCYVHVAEGTESLNVGQVQRQGTKESITGTSHTVNISGLNSGVLHTIHILPVSPNFFWPAAASTATATTTITDVTGPVLQSSTPADEATGVALTSPSITLVFDENVQEGTSGNIILRKDSGGFANEEVFDVTAGQGTSPGQINISGTDVTIYMTSDYDASTAYAVRVDAGAIRDTAPSPNDFAGILDDTTLNFTTAAAGSSLAFVQHELDYDGNGFGTNKAYDIPAGVVSGNMMVITMRTPRSMTAISTPPGWSLVDAYIDSGSGGHISVWSKVSDGTEGGTTVNWSITGSTQKACFYFAEIAGASQVEAVLNSSSEDPPAITPTGGSADTILLISTVAKKCDLNVTAAPAGYTATTPLQIQTNPGS
ncbi:hypothetical protein IWQ49_006353, partial [Labrenzia sp. EL_126]|nr:hypothetical protein [Labrenzia sp. EL_126]